MHTNITLSLKNHTIIKNRVFSEEFYLFAARHTETARKAPSALRNAIFYLFYQIAAFLLFLCRFFWHTTSLQIIFLPFLRLQNLRTTATDRSLWKSAQTCKKLNTIKTINYNKNSLPAMPTGCFTSCRGVIRPQKTLSEELQKTVAIKKRESCCLR